MGGERDLGLMSLMWALLSPLDHVHFCVFLLYSHLVICYICQVQYNGSTQELTQVESRVDLNFIDFRLRLINSRHKAQGSLVQLCLLRRNYVILS
jgi:hypothetical protein